ncbi:MAG: hypothetical protein IKJ13_00030 [Clostridia bacterium]|nr:hypothetical protein [Clostridia bacterium]
MNNNQYGYLNDSTLLALQRAIDSYKSLPNIAQLHQLQREINAVKIPLEGVYAAVAEYQRIVAPLNEEIARLNNLYEPILMASRCFESVYNDATIAALKSAATAMKSALGVNFSEITNIAHSLSQYTTLSQSILENIDFEETAKLYEDGTISNEDIAEEFKEIVATKKFSLIETWNNVKKAKWFIAIRTIFLILLFLGDPVVEKVKDAAFEAFGVYDFWEESGIYERIDEFFNTDDPEVEPDAIDETATTTEGE